jgi:REP element-mobilizing transposase RayT
MYRWLSVELEWPAKKSAIKPRAFGRSLYSYGNGMHADGTEPRPSGSANLPHHMGLLRNLVAWPGRNSRLPEPDANREQLSRARMAQQCYLLHEIRRPVVLKTLREVCAWRGWTLLAAHVRTNHVHVVTTADCKPEQVMTAMKAYSSRALNESAVDAPGRRRWARHGSARYLWTKNAVGAAVEYVIREQAESMAVFEMFPLANARGSVGRAPRPDPTP